MINIDHFRPNLADSPPNAQIFFRTTMKDAKDTARALVRLGFDGRVHKTFKGPQAQERFDNEVRVLQYLEERGCPFVPRLLEQEPERLHLVTTNCGQRVERVSEKKRKQLFLSLEQYGVRHDDPFVRNITYRMQDGRFCIIDFEFSTILEETAPPPPHRIDDDKENAGQGATSTGES